MDGLFNSRQQGCEPENGLFVNHSIPLSCTSTETMLQEKTERKEKKNGTHVNYRISSSLDRELDLHISFIKQI